MSSWQTRAVSLVLRTTRRPARSTRERGERALEHPRDAAIPPADVRRRLARRHVGERGAYPTDRVPPSGPRRLVPGAAVIYLHGGAFVDGIAKQHWQLVGELADVTGAPVYVPHYGRAPGHTAAEVPGLIDALVAEITAWDGHGGPVRTHLVGDSAGGTLALLAAQQYRGDERIVGVTLISPALDLTLSNPAIEEVEKTDPWLTREGLRPLLAAWAGDLPLDDPQVSPLYGDLSGLPPIEVFAGTRDICWPDVAVLEQKAREAGTPIRVHSAEGSPHVHVLLPTPEGRRDRATLIREVLRSLTG